MARNTKKPLIAILVVGGLFFSYRIFRYYTHSKQPQVSIAGCVSGMHYAGIVEGSVQAKTGYPVDMVALSVDGKILDGVGNKKIGKATFELPFTIDTTALSDGRHELVVRAVDGSHKKNVSEKTVSFTVDNRPIVASFEVPDSNIAQGRTLHARLKLNKPVSAVTVSGLGQIHDAFVADPQGLVYEAFLPTDCEQIPQAYTLQADIVDFVGNSETVAHELRVQSVTFPKQKGFHVSGEKLDEEKELSINTKVLEDALCHWLDDSPKKKLWDGPFIMPCQVQRISTPFGELRMTAEKGRYFHKAIDIVNHPRSVVWAAQDGRVIIKDRFLFPGNIVVLDHGLGVFSMYCHLDEFADIEVGDMVKKGAPIGRLGDTGYAAGYHLHWELRVNNVAVDPLQWTEHTF